MVKCVTADTLIYHLCRTMNVGVAFRSFTTTDHFLHMSTVYLQISLTWELHCLVIRQWSRLYRYADCIVHRPIKSYTVRDWHCNLLNYNTTGLLIWMYHNPNRQFKKTIFPRQYIANGNVMEFFSVVSLYILFLQSHRGNTDIYGCYWRPVYYRWRKSRHIRI